jgi:hypothetical protein
MVLAYHVIFGAYGFWLPNDPRGSWSTEVWAKHLRRFGDATKVNTRQSLAGREHDQSLRHEAKQHLQYPAVHFTPRQVQVVGDGFSQAVTTLKLDVYACSVMPDHLHLVVGRCRDNIEYVAGFLKRAATRQFNAEHVHPLQGRQRADGRTPSPWVVGGWFVYLSSPAEVRGRIRYVEDNPTKAGLPPQSWPFVRPYSAQG